MALSYADVLEGWQALRTAIDLHNARLADLSSTIARIEDDALRVKLMSDLTTNIYDLPPRILRKLYFLEEKWEREALKLQKNRQKVAKWRAREEAGLVRGRRKSIPNEPPEYYNLPPAKSFYEQAVELYGGDSPPDEPSTEPSPIRNLNEVPTSAPNAKGKLNF